MVGIMKSHCVSCGKKIDRRGHPERHFRDNGNYCTRCNAKCHNISAVRNSLERLDRGEMLTERETALLRKRLGILLTDYNVTPEHIRETRKDISFVKNLFS